MFGDNEFNLVFVQKKNKKGHTTVARDVDSKRKATAIEGYLRYQHAGSTKRQEEEYQRKLTHFKLGDDTCSSHLMSGLTP